MAHYTDQFVQIGSTRVSVLRGGEGEPLLFLHGAGGRGPWHPFLEQLAQHYDVIAPEHPGFGRSDEPEWLEEIYDLVLFYRDFLDQFNLEKVHLVGHSLGGWLAAEFAVAYRERLHSLTLVDAAGIFVPGVMMGDNFMWNWEERVRNLYHDEKLVEEILSRPLSSEEMDVLVKNNETAAKLAWNPRWHNPKLKKRLDRITVPTLVVWGENDRLFPIEYAWEWEKLIPNARLAVIKECGHSPQIEKPDQFVTHLFHFYKQLSS